MNSSDQCKQVIRRKFYEIKLQLFDSISFLRKALGERKFTFRLMYGLNLNFQDHRCMQLLNSRGFR